MSMARMSAFLLHRLTGIAFCVSIVLFRGQHLYFQTQVNGAVYAIVFSSLALFALLKVSTASFWYLVLYYTYFSASLALAIIEMTKKSSVLFGWNFLLYLFTLLLVVSFSTMIFDTGVRQRYLHKR
jgi:hypothetical protein